MSALEAITLLLVSLYFFYVTKDWRYWYYCINVLQVIIIIGVIWLPESPDFLFAKGRFNESKDVLFYIAKYNGKQVESNQI